LNFRTPREIGMASARRAILRLARKLLFSIESESQGDEMGQILFSKANAEF
jgi:hypothetical protein